MASHSHTRYAALLEKIFFDHYKKGDRELAWHRSSLEKAARDLRVELPKNLGDVIYSMRYRTELPKSIQDTQPAGSEWVILGRGRGEYAFVLVGFSRIVPGKDLPAIKIPDSTPEIVQKFARGDEQALLASVRYNRLVDIFLGITCYSLQNHWRTTIGDGIQMEIDEIYAGIDKCGHRYVVPVQAKSASDQIGVVQVSQDLECCAEKFPGSSTRAVSVQSLDDNIIAMFEIGEDAEGLRVIDERHYSLVSAGLLDDSGFTDYGRR